MGTLGDLVFGLYTRIHITTTNILVLRNPGADSSTPIKSPSTLAPSMEGMALLDNDPLGDSVEVIDLVSIISLGGFCRLEFSLS